MDLWPGSLRPEIQSKVDFTISLNRWGLISNRRLLYNLIGLPSPKQLSKISGRFGLDCRGQKFTQRSMDELPCIAKARNSFKGRPIILPGSPRPEKQSERNEEFYRNPCGLSFDRWGVGAACRTVYVSRSGWLQVSLLDSDESSSF